MATHSLPYGTVNVTFNMPVALHDAIRRAARAEGKNRNSFGEAAFVKAVGVYLSEADRLRIEMRRDEMKCGPRSR